MFKWVKRFLLGVCLISLILLTYYFFQPIKKGFGIDKTTSYQLVAAWPKLPKKLVLGNPTGLGIDSNQNLVVFCRADRSWPLLGQMPNEFIKQQTIHIIDHKTGQIIKSWGENMFIMPHGLTVDRQNNIWVTDVGLNQIFKFSHDGELILTLGKAGVAGKDQLHFDQPTDIAVTKDGSFYVSDGYGNSRVVKFTAEGKYLFEFGKNGNQKGEFNIPHALTLDSLENIYVADRENERIQVFDTSGKFIKEIANTSFGSICSVTFNEEKSKMYAIDDFTFLKIKHRGSDVFILDKQNEIQTRFGRSSMPKIEPTWYHDIAVDKDENIYVGDILNNRISKFEKVKSQ